MPDGQDQIDGRTARRDRNRDAVLDAALDLFREDAMFPAPAEIAERSSVSTRSVQRYFPDMDTLVRAAMARHLERVAPLFVVPDIGVGERDDRITRMVELRVGLHEALAPMIRAALMRRTNDLIRRRLIEGRAQLRSQVVDMFAPELDAMADPARDEIVEALDALLSFEALEHLREARGLGAAETESVLCRAVKAILTSA